MRHSTIVEGCTKLTLQCAGVGGNACGGLAPGMGGILSVDRPPTSKELIVLEEGLFLLSGKRKNAGNLDKVGDEEKAAGDVKSDRCAENGGVLKRKVSVDDPEDGDGDGDKEYLDRRVEDAPDFQRKKKCSEHGDDYTKCPNGGDPDAPDFQRVKAREREGKEQEVNDEFSACRGRTRLRSSLNDPEIRRQNRKRTPLYGRTGRRDAISIAIAPPVLNPHSAGGRHLLTKGLDDILGLEEDEPTLRNRLLHRRRSSLQQKQQKQREQDEREGYESANKRYISKHHGNLHINYTNIPTQKKRIFADLFHLVVESPWSIFLIVFTLAFVLSWLLFACFWFALVRYDEECVASVDSFTTAFLYSIETQTTIGYGGRAVTHVCSVGVMLLCAQFILGAFIISATLGTMFAKMSRPNNRGHTVRFTKTAVITLRDGKYCFIFRIVDLPKKKLFTTNVRLLLVKHRFTKEGHFIPVDVRDLKVTIDYHQVEYTLNIFPIYPVSIVHIIDKHSPLYHLTKRKLYDTTLEVVAIMEGTIPSNGNTTQTVASYKPTEMRWGHRFQPLFCGRMEGEKKMVVDLENFDGLIKESVTPDHSAQEFEKRKAEGDEADGEEESEGEYAF